MVKTLIMIGLFSIMIYGFTSVLSDLNTSQSEMLKRQQRTLANNLNEKLNVNAYSIHMASLLSENIALNACIYGKQTPACIDEKCCLHNEEFPLILPDLNFDISGLTPQARLDKLEKVPRITGSRKRPIVYSENGLPGCEDNCAYTISSMASAHCAGSEPTCSHAEHLTITLEIKGLNDKGYLVKDETRTLTLPVDLNHSPVLNPIDDIIVVPYSINSYTVLASTGHPSEHQNLAFIKCHSHDLNIAEIDCVAFTGKIGSYTIKAQQPGTTKITLSISDGQSENNLSKEIEFGVRVVP